MTFRKRTAADLAVKATSIARLATHAANISRSTKSRPPTPEQSHIDQFRNTPHPLLGGISLMQAKRVFDDFKKAVGPLSRKKMWFLEVQGLGGRDPDTVGLNIDLRSYELFHMLACEVSFTPYTITGERRRIGALTTDCPQEGGHTEMRLTTYDNEAGELKKWFAARANAVVLSRKNELGLVGLPSEYLFVVRVTAGYGHQETIDALQESKAGSVPYVDEFLMRVGQMDLEYSRRDEGMQELQMTFVETDMFMPF